MLRIRFGVGSYLGGLFLEALGCFSLGLQFYEYIKTTWKRQKPDLWRRRAGIVQLQSKDFSCTKANSIQKLNRDDILACRVSRWQWDTLNSTHCLRTWDGGMSNGLEESWFVNQSREQTSLAPVVLNLSLWIMAASDLAFSRNFPRFIPGFNTARLCAETSVRYESSSFKVRLLSSASRYPGMSLRDPAGLQCVATQPCPCCLGASPSPVFTSLAPLLFEILF